MTALFNGLAQTLAGVFGETITVTPTGGTARQITAVLRNREVLTEDDLGRSIATTEPVLRASQTDIADLAEGDLITSSGGVNYAYQYQRPALSPADDARAEIVLRRIT